MEKNKKGLSVFSLTMLTLGTVIGGSFFLGVAFPIASTGLSIILSFLYSGLLVYFILFALSELTVNNPTKGSFRTYTQKIFGNGAGFILGWVYWTGLIIAMSSEAVAVSILFKTFFPFIPISLIGTIIIFLVIIINLLGTHKLSILESTLAGIKLLAIVVFIIIGLMIILGIVGNKPLDFTEIKEQPVFTNGFTGFIGSTLIVMFAYAGFEVIGLAATETKNPEKIIPRAILITVLSLIILYVISIIVLLLIIPIDLINENQSPFVAALLFHNIEYAAKAINIVLIIAILSTMLAAIFGVARMLRSLADDNYAPKFLKDTGDIPYRGIIFSGLMIFIFFSLSFFLPQEVYLFLVSSSGFTLLFTYFMIVLSHYQYRKRYGCKDDKCQLPIFPISSWIALVSLILIILFMSFVKGQGLGLIAGIMFVLFYMFLYIIFFKKRQQL